MTDARCACMPSHATYRHCSVRVRMAYWYVTNGWFPDVQGGVDDLENLLWDCRTFWLLTDVELRSVENMYYVDYPLSDDSGNSDE